MREESQVQVKKWQKIKKKRIINKNIINYIKMLGSRKNKKVEKKVKKWQEDLDRDMNTNDCEKVGVIEEQSNNNISLNTDENGLIKTEGEVEISHENKEQEPELNNKQEGKKYDWMSSSDEVGKIDLKKIIMLCLMRKKWFKRVKDAYNQRKMTRT
jgi:hypothetical protein